MALPDIRSSRYDSHTGRRSGWLLKQSVSEVPGFVGIIDDREDISTHINAATKALERSREEMHSGKFDIVILDELNVALDLGLLKLETVLDLIRGKPEALHLIITGRDAHEKVIEMADLVTEMREIKHPFKKGILAQEGIDF